MTPTTPILSRAARGCALLVALCLSSGCERVQPVRTLPSWVRGVYIPMVQNRTVEPGLEETVTRLVQEEFLADGRLEVEAKDSADVQLRAVIETWRLEYDGFDDDIATRRELTIVAGVQLLEPYDDPFDPKEPVIADLGRVATTYFYNHDQRSTYFQTEVDANEDALRQLARNIVFQTINGFPTQIEGAPAGSDPLRIFRPREDVQGDFFREQRFDDGF